MTTKIEKTKAPPLVEWMRLKANRVFRNPWCEKGEPLSYIMVVFELGLLRL